MLYVTALDQYCQPMFEGEKCIGLFESMELFYEICNAKWFRKSVIVLLLNKTDLFRESLKITPLTFCFGNAYKGRNFGDGNDIKTAVQIMTKILHLFIDCINDRLNMPNDIIQIIGSYVDMSEIMSEWWLSLCYQDGIDFIRNRFLSLNGNPNKKIYVYEVIAIDEIQMGNIMSEVHDIIIENRNVQFPQILSNVTRS